jgi:hypothetical protein
MMVLILLMGWATLLYKSYNDARGGTQGSNPSTPDLLFCGSTFPELPCSFLTGALIDTGIH